MAVERKAITQEKEQAPKKRSRDESRTPESRPRQKKAKASTPDTTGVPTRAHKTPGTSYAGALKQFRIAIMPANYPRETLSNEELTTLEESLIEEVAKGWEGGKLGFEGIHFKPGMLVIECQCEKSLKWVELTVPHLSSWKGKHLTTRMGNEIPKKHTISVFFPRSTKEDEKKILNLIQAQNEGIKTDDWKVHSAKTEGPGAVLVIGIDEDSAETILKGGHSLNFRFGRVSVRGLRKNPVEKETRGNDPDAKPSSPIPMEIPPSETEEEAAEGELGEENAPSIASISDEALEKALLEEDFPQSS